MNAYGVESPGISPRQLFELTITLEKPFFAIPPGKGPAHLERFVDRDGKRFIDVKATVPCAGIATIDDAPVLAYFCTALFSELEHNPDAREVTFKRCDLLRRIHRDIGGGQYKGLAAALLRLSTTEVTTNMGPDGSLAEAVTFRYLEDWKQNEKGTLHTVRVSDWFAMGFQKRYVVSLPEWSLSMGGAYERILWRIARRHVLDPNKSFEIGLTRLWEKSGKPGRQAAFNNKIKAIVMSDPFEEYEFTWIEDPKRRMHKVRMQHRMLPKILTKGPCPGEITL